ncbi:hypothetical protein P280DRAFT_302683 [Massarina eburnea CBS 473.64]|uniref:Uncharacterized protein n=1 Tax=Massarina eburnea CBS 473.64 TaxID=1395130 RepID=A0A6A6S4K1_9PLEO|nr:hypothetical protein P280DRAFT_302683 [Massarina eburnea CBS 473.64]
MILLLLFLERLYLIALIFYFVLWWGRGPFALEWRCAFRTHGTLVISFGETFRHTSLGSSFTSLHVLLSSSERVSIFAVTLLICPWRGDELV